MSEQLPISINSSDELITQLITMKRVINKLEAQFNFQTLIAGWYGDEGSILFIELNLEMPQGFLQEKKAQCSTQNSNDIIHYSDDVFSYNIPYKEKQCLVCCIAVTQIELDLLTEQPKVLASFMQVKLKKTLNLLAKQLVRPFI